MWTTISICRAQEAVVKLKREMDNQFLRKVNWNVMTNWAHGVVTMINEGNRMLEHQLKKKEHIIMAMDTHEARVREKEIRKRVPALYVEAIKTLRANKHINAITVAGTILKKHTGVMQPEDWVGAITDKLGDFKVSGGGHVEPSNRFLLTRKTEELHEKMDTLKQERCTLQNELERLRFEEGMHLDPAVRHGGSELRGGEEHGLVCSHCRQSARRTGHCEGHRDPARTPTHGDAPHPQRSPGV